MEEKKEILLPSKRFKKADEQELNINLSLESSQTLLRIGDKDIVLDIDKLYDKERNESKKYKIYGKLKMVFRNMYSGDTSYNYLQERLYLNGKGDGVGNPTLAGFLPYDEFAFLRRDLYREINTATNSGSTLGEFTYVSGATGPTGHTKITPITAPYHNWNLYLSYVNSKDTNYTMVYTLTGSTKTEGSNIIHFKSGDGIPFRLSYSGGSYYEFTSPVEHGMNSGEFVTLSGTTITGSTSGRTYYIESVGNETYNSEKYVLNVLKKEFKSGTTVPSLVIGKRCLDKNNITNSTSEYYVHKHKLLTTTADYIMDNIGFESPIWEEEKKILFENAAGANDTIVERNRMESVIYDFKEPFTLTGLTNNLGYTPTEVYVTTIFRNGDGYFNYPPKVGYKFNFHDTWIDEHFNGDTSLETGITGSTTFSPNTAQSGYSSFTKGNEQVGSILNGAFVEYNKKELKERIISNSFHKFSSRKDIFNHYQDQDSQYSGSSATNMVGIYYQSHYKVKLRELSPYTENAKTKDIFNLPENTKYDSDEGVWRWRDLYDHGYVDIDGYGTNFPFTNGIHYVKNDINFYLRNEMFYSNKQDGITKFKDKKITDC